MPSLYNPAIPTGTVELDQDYQNLQNNFQQLDTTYKVDHVALTDNTTSNGYHTIIHQQKNVTNTDPAPIAGVNQIYVKEVTPNTTVTTADTQLFSITGAGGISQLTGNFAASEGYQWIGGMLLQWGNVNLPGTNNPNGTVTFKDRVVGAIPFPTSCLNVTLTLQANATTAQANSIAVLGSLSATSFNWVFTGSTSYNKFYWFAVGY